MAGGAKLALGFSPSTVWPLICKIQTLCLPGQTEEYVSPSTAALPGSRSTTVFSVLRTSIRLLLKPNRMYMLPPLWYVPAGRQGKYGL